jgi:hypothetical protein
MFLPLYSIILVTMILRVVGRHLYPFQVKMALGSISNDNMKDCCFMYNQGGKLYGTNMTGQVLCEEVMVPKGLKPSVANPSLTFRGFNAKFGCLSSKDFHASPFVGCLKTPFFVRQLACHLI